MPYIRQDRRNAIDSFLYGLHDAVETPGDLAYLIARVMLEYWRRDPSYARWAQLRGVVDDQVDEFRRRIISQYEDRKRGENGDVY